MAVRRKRCIVCSICLVARERCLARASPRGRECRFCKAGGDKWWQDRTGCEPKLWDQAAAFDDASGWLRLAGADGLSASAAQ